MSVDASLIAAYPGRESIADFWKATDVSFTNNFSAQITKSIGVNLTAQWLYDKFDSAALVDPARLGEAAAMQDGDAVAHILDVGEEVAGQQDGLAGLGQQRRGRLFHAGADHDQRLRLGRQGHRLAVLDDALALAHASAAASLRSLSTTGAVEPWRKCLELANEWGWRKAS